MTATIEKGFFVAELLGFVKQIFRYPVKSMAGEELAAAELGWHGLDGDRRFAFRRLGDMSGFPWLTAGKLPGLLSYRPAYPTPGAPGPQVRITTPEGDELAGDSPLLRERVSAAFGSPVELLYLKQGIYDEAPLALISTATIAAISETAGSAPDVRRFRPNLLVETSDGQPFSEDAWVGRLLAIGEGGARPTISIAQRDPRCSMINLDPDTAQADPRMLKASAQLNRACAGVYGAAFSLGTLKVGDPIYGW
jgi:uncharacterized protein YcbX